MDAVVCPECRNEVRQRSDHGGKCELVILLVQELEYQAMQPDGPVPWRDYYRTSYGSYRVSRAMAEGLVGLALEPGRVLSTRPLVADLERAPSERRVLVWLRQRGVQTAIDLAIILAIAAAAWHLLR